jgi:hypothetical protein
MSQGEEVPGTPSQDNQYILSSYSSDRTSYIPTNPTLKGLDNIKVGGHHAPIKSEGRMKVTILHKNSQAKLQD